MRSLIIFIFALAGVCMSGGLPASAQTAPPEDVIILFDASASMLAQSNGEAKVDTGRRAVADFLAALAPASRTGLVVFGHSRAGSCDDIATLVPLGADRSAIGASLSALRPRGVTPLSSALEKIANDYKGQDRPLTVFLISDGGDQCFRDPCALAKSLADANAQVVANVVGLGTDAEHDLPQLKCIADATGGRFVAVEDVVELARVSSAPVVPVDDGAMVRFSLRAVDSAGNVLSPPVPIIWALTPLSDDGGRAGPATFKRGPVAIFDVTPGRYRIEAAQGEDAKQTFDIQIAAGQPVDRDVTFTNGIVRLNARLAKGLEADDTLFLGWVVEREAPDGKREQVAQEAGDSVRFVLPAGTYRATVRSEDLQLSFRLVVEAYTERSETITLNAGRLAVSGPRGTSWRLFRAGADGKEQLAASEVAGSTTFLLEEGPYTLQARVEKETRREQVRVIAGETIKYDLSTSQEQLRLQPEGQ